MFETSLYFKNLFGLNIKHDCDGNKSMPINYITFAKSLGIGQIWCFQLAFFQLLNVSIVIWILTWEQDKKWNYQTECIWFLQVKCFYTYLGESSYCTSKSKCIIRLTLIMCVFWSNFISLPKGLDFGIFCDDESHIQITFLYVYSKALLCTVRDSSVQIALEDNNHYI